jgi:hypothetical protein
VDRKRYFVGQDGESLYSQRGSEGRRGGDVGRDARIVGATGGGEGRRDGRMGRSKTPISAVGQVECRLDRFNPGGFAMKKKMKSLKLNRETIARLGKEALSEAKGGLNNGELKCTGCPSGCGIFPDEQLDNS